MLSCAGNNLLSEAFLLVVTSDLHSGSALEERMVVPGAAQRCCNLVFWSWILCVD